MAIVTGAASGIGRAIAEDLAFRGCRVVACDLEQAAVQEVAQAIRDRGLSATGALLDVQDFPRFLEVIGTTADEFGRLDFVFNNAGIAAGGEVLDLTPDDWQRVINVNLGGTINGVLAAYPVMRDQGFGHIINTSSMQGLLPAPLTAAYATTKHAIVGLSKSLRAEAAIYGVRVSVLCPGVIRTPLLEGGRHGVFLRTMPQDRQRELMRAFFERFRPMDPRAFASKAIDQVSRNRAIIVIPSWWKLLWWVDRASPSLSILLAKSIVARQARRLLGPSAG